MSTMHQPRPQGAFPWLWRWGGKSPTSKAREKRLGDEVDYARALTNRECFWANLEEFQDI